MLVTDAALPAHMPAVTRLLASAMVFCTAWAALIWLQRRNALGALSTLRLTSSTALAI
jgi:hypothetical protein